MPRVGPPAAPVAVRENPGVDTGKRGNEAEPDSDQDEDESRPIGYMQASMDNPSCAATNAPSACIVGAGMTP